MANRAPDPKDPADCQGQRRRDQAERPSRSRKRISARNPPSLHADAKRDYLITYLADIMLVAKAAESKKIADTPEFQNRLTHLRNKLLAELMLQAETKAAVTDAAMRKVYDEATKGMGTEQEVRARHILIRVVDQSDEKASKEAEDKIKAIIERLNKGEDFVKLASELTEDPSGKQNGGDLDYFTKETDGSGILLRRLPA